MLNRSAATTARDSLQNAVNDHDKCLAEAVKRSQDLFTLRQESSHGLVADVEAYVNSLANTPKSYDRTFTQYHIELSAFDDTVTKIDSDLRDTAVKGGAGAGVGVAAGAATALMGPTAAMAIATTFGTASTGTAIASLSGAAATNAALAWLGGGAVAAGGGGVAAGNALLVLAGPVGWTLAGLAVAGGVAYTAYSNSNAADEANKARIEVEAAICSLKACILSISELYDLTELHVVGMKNILSTLVKQDIKDYRAMSEKSKDLLIALVNHVQTLAALLNKTVSLDPES